MRQTQRQSVLTAIFTASQHHFCHPVSPVDPADPLCGPTADKNAATSLRKLKMVDGSAILTWVVLASSSPPPITAPNIADTTIRPPNWI